MEAKHNNFCSLECMLYEQNRFTNAASMGKVKSKKKKKVFTKKSGVRDNCIHKTIMQQYR
jgi:hypothetical protein